tara:strand:+ start:9358 stop:10578 length:1221 start_codon:yes stop_codon:yes gene_type:complete
MRLNLISEAGLSRRSLLKRFGAAAASASTGGLPGLAKAALGGVTSQNAGLGAQALASLYKNLSGPVQKLVDDFTFDFVNANQWGGDSGEDLNAAGKFLAKYVKSGVVHYRRIVHDAADPYKNGDIEFTPETTDEFGRPLPSFPIKAVIGRVLDEPTNWHITACLLTGNQPEAFNLIQPNAVSDLIGFAIDKNGIENMVSTIANMAEDAGMIDFGAWKVALTNPTLSKFLDMTPEMIRAVEETGIGLRKMVEKGMASRDYASDWADELRDRPGREERQRIEDKEERELEEWKERQRQEKLEKEKPEEIIPRKDDYLVSSMHQPFESRLEIALRQISENELANKLDKKLHGSGYLNRPAIQTQALYDPANGSDSGSRTAGDTQMATGVPKKPRHREFLGFEKRNNVTL